MGNYRFECKKKKGGEDEECLIAKKYAVFAIKCRSKYLLRYAFETSFFFSFDFCPF